MGTAGEVGTTDRAPVVPPTMLIVGTSLTVPHVPQSAQRPTHLAGTCWHSEQR